jgi:hypothetical protein
MGLVKQLVRRVSKFKKPFNTFALHTRQDIGSATGKAMKSGGTAAKNMGLYNLGKSLQKNAPKAQRYASKHPLKMLLGVTGLSTGAAVGTYKFKRRLYRGQSNQQKKIKPNYVGS